MPSTKFVQLFLVGFFSFLLIFLGGASVFGYKLGLFQENISTPTETHTTIPSEKGVAQFSSVDDFKEYIKDLSTAYSAISSTFGGDQMLQMTTSSAETGMAQKVTGITGLERTSQTNVQVLGIDEPDIVKTDKGEIYLSSEYAQYYPLMQRSFFEEDVRPPAPQDTTKVIKAYPPESLAEETAISQNGTLLLDNDVLLIFAGDAIYGYDVADPKNATRKWEIKLEDGNEIEAARLLDKTVYLVTKTQINIYSPCPLTPLSFAGEKLTIECTDIYHPVLETQVDVTYTAMTINPQTGKIGNTISLVGSSSSSVIYMSSQAVYLSYSHFVDLIQFFSDFFSERAPDLIPTAVLDKIAELSDYDLSANAKYVEFQTILENWQNSLQSDKRLQFENEMNNRMTDYLTEHARELEQTEIIKIGIPEFEILANGEVPGSLLNQFSLDEYEDNLRVATTISSSNLGNSESLNDLYVLDENLEELGFLKDLGKGERIYAVRFVEDKGYVVTFREVDPFFVIDLSEAASPALAGELKIPGYSSYLHPISQDKILGIGKEGSQVKISLFDVADPQNPSEEDKYTLNEYWSDVLETHHAFLLDAKHEIFFIPGTRGGYVFSYTDDQLKLEKTVADWQVQRALYINDYLYILGSNQIVVLNEADWSEVKRLSW
ncbi:hypothetical protein CO015_03775 [candidate division WWE3 bacterium CG_4_8_14_3_um_filter_42_11]|uniref:Beta propeller domain-containing protein n=1 Tax=candidate division WWE3 bacterium CG_4_8_14_3_um_filter_42_11 TaxID=1975076 RepID=A0A2M8G6J0_UNCKA|nr:MAG: hypothetical protein CO015_03775 [candidate division WWE3 bacterium CG_4_8_14_3_um_filter_42_11]